MIAPIEKLLSALREHDCNPRKSAAGWSAQCRAHDDRSPSLSASEGDDGRALLRCHSGCSVEAVCAAIGLRVSDLMPTADMLPTQTKRQSTRKTPNESRQPRAKPRGKAYPTARDAVTALDSMMAKTQGRRVDYWTYHDATGNEVAVIVRYDLPTDNGEKQRKEFRPVSRHGGQWFIKGMLEPRPLYGLPELANATRVYITEGEKAADAARSIGLITTTSAHGSQSPDKTDWSPLAGKECILLPDHDDAGKTYALAVAAILAKLSPPSIVKIVELPGLPEHGDIADWVNAL